MNVADYIADFLVKKGIQHVFGFQGGAILKLLDAMMDTGKIAYIQNYHEQASGFSADAYGRVSGPVGVALATSGPGATNLVTGIANAHLDSIPTLFITGQDYTANATRKNGSRQNGFQDLDIVSLVQPVTKYAAAVIDPSRMRYELEKAFHLATTGRPGAVLLDIPIDIQFKDIDVDALEPFVPEAPHYDFSNLPQVVNLLTSAKRPVVLAGGGIHISHAESHLKELVALTNIPVVNTLNGLDAIEGSYSFAGLHGNTFANLAIQNADVLLVLGARLGQRQVGKTPEKYTTAKVIHIDIDPAEFNRAMPEEISIQSDLKTFLTELVQSLAQKPLPDHTQWHAQIQKWEASYATTTHMSTSGIDPVRAVKAMAPMFQPSAVITNDVGQNQMWVSQAFRKTGTQRLLNSSGLGSMGYSLPAAIGAYFARPGAQIICFTGDGGLQMNIQEFMLMGQRQLPIKCIVMNNNTLGMMREVQKRYYKEHYYGACPEDFACVNLEKIAAAYNLNYILLTEESQIPGLQAALNDNKPYVIDMRIEFDSRLSNRYDEASIFDAERISG